MFRTCTSTSLKRRAETSTEPYDKLAKSGVRQRSNASPGRHHESWKRRGSPNADRGCLELSIPCAHQPGALLRQEGLAKPIRDTAWKAQERLCRRYRKLARAGKPPTVVTSAIARELSGFVWAIAKHAQVAAA